MLYSCTDMAIVGVKGLRFRHQWLTHDADGAVLYTAGERVAGSD